MSLYLAALGHQNPYTAPNRMRDIEMTSTLSPHDTGDIRLGEGTRDLTYLLRPPMRRPDATGEQPIYRPATIGDLDAPVDELTRLALGETLVLPVGAQPVPPREPAPAVYRPEVADVVKPFLGRGCHRMKTPWPRWAFGAVLFGSGWASCAAVTLAGLFVMAVTR